MTPNYQLANIQQAIEAHFADIDRLGIRQGNNRVTTTTIYIDNAKAISITSTRSKICVCKIHDPRIIAILNSHQLGIMFLNTSYSCMFGYDQARLLNAITLLINSAIPNCANDRITRKDGDIQKSMYLLYSFIAIFVILLIASAINMIWDCGPYGLGLILIALIPELLAIFISKMLISKGHTSLTPSLLMSLGPLVCIILMLLSAFDFI